MFSWLEYFIDQQNLIFEFFKNGDTDSKQAIFDSLTKLFIPIMGEFLENVD